MQLCQSYFIMFLTACTKVASVGEFLETVWMEVFGERVVFK